MSFPKQFFPLLYHNTSLTSVPSHQRYVPGQTSASSTIAEPDRFIHHELLFINRPCFTHCSHFAIPFSSHKLQFLSPVFYICTLIRLALDATFSAQRIKFRPWWRLCHLEFFFPQQAQEGDIGITLVSSSLRSPFQRQVLTLEQKAALKVNSPVN